MSDQEFEQSKTLDHPCKQTCSGWEQGRLRGQREVLESEEIKNLLSQASYIVGALNNKSGVMHGSMFADEQSHRRGWPKV